MAICRDAVPDDAPALAELGRATFAETFGHLYTSDNLAAFLWEGHNEGRWRAELADPAFAVQLAEVDGRAVGYAQLGPVTLVDAPRLKPAIELRRLYILKPWHGTGIAAELMDWSLAEARRRSVRELYLSVYIDNHRARRFYARYSFKRIGSYAFKVGEHEDEDLIMRLELEG
jgi:diamine N-acetyltransferase